MARPRPTDERASPDGFRELVRLGRYDEACALGESFLDAAPTLDHIRAFWNPWGGLPRDSFAARHEAVLKEMISHGRFLPLATYLLVNLSSGPDNEALERLVGLSRDRYGWMAGWLSQRLLSAGKWGEAVAVAREALDYRLSDWSDGFRLVEALICAGREDEALKQCRVALRATPRDARPSALAWNGEILLWFGRYREAEVALAESCEGEFPLAWCWRGAAAMLLGRPEEALPLFDAGLSRQPDDREARVWRGETLRRLGRLDEAERDLELAVPGVWKAVNIGLLSAARGDDEGLHDELARLPFDVVRFVEGKLDGNSRGAERIMTKALELARGFRREDYHQRVWLR